MDHKSKIISYLEQQLLKLNKTKPTGWNRNFNLYQSIIPFVKQETCISNMDDVVRCLRKSGLKLTKEKYPWKTKILKEIDSLINNNYLLVSSSEEDISSEDDIASLKHTYSPVIYTVSKINNIIKSNIKSLFHNDIEMSCEISSVSKHNSNIYLSLKDEGAKIRGIIWKSNNHSIPEIKVGDELIVTGILDAYVKTGEYQIIIKKIKPKGIGNIKENYEKTKLQLKQNGYFDLAHKKKIPRFNYNIGIISSLNAAGFGDILHKIRSRSNWNNIYLISTSVQGKKSSQEIAQAIKKFHEINIKLDVIVITRGGGSSEDLESYNNIDLVKTIYNSSIPIVTAIGHERDVSLCDLVADYHAITPTAAGELVSIDTDNLLRSISNYKTLISDKISNKILGKKLYLSEIKSVKHNYITNIVNKNISNFKTTIIHKINSKLDVYNNYLKKTIDLLEKQDPINHVNLKIKNYINTSRDNVKQKLDIYKNCFNLYEKQLNIYNPNSILKQGFCFLEVDGKNIVTKQQLQESSRLHKKLKIYLKNNEVFTLEL